MPLTQDDLNAIRVIVRAELADNNPTAAATLLDTTLELDGGNGRSWPVSKFLQSIQRIVRFRCGPGASDQPLPNTGTIEQDTAAIRRKLDA